jgi:predicted CoA-binding protein
MKLAAPDPLAVMLEPRSVALVGASPRAGSLGARMIEEVAKSPSGPRAYLVNPRYTEIGGVPCYPGLTALPESVDLAMLAVPNAALEEQLAIAAEARVRSVLIFGSAFDSGGGHGLRDRLATTAREAGLPVCGAGCMGFVNVARGLRAIGLQVACSDGCKAVQNLAYRPARMSLATFATTQRWSGAYPQERPEKHMTKRGHSSRLGRGFPGVRFAPKL